MVWTAYWEQLQLLFCEDNSDMVKSTLLGHYEDTFLDFLLVPSRIQGETLFVRTILGLLESDAGRLAIALVVTRS